MHKSGVVHLRLTRTWRHFSRRTKKDTEGLFWQNRCFASLLSGQLSEGLSNGLLLVDLILYKIICDLWCRNQYYFPPKQSSQSQWAEQKRHLHIDLSHAFNQAKDASQQCILAETLWPLKNQPAGTVVSAESLSHRSDPHKRVKKRKATNAGGRAGRGNLNSGLVSVRFEECSNGDKHSWGASASHSGVSHRWHHILGRQGTPCGESFPCHFRTQALVEQMAAIWLSSHQVKTQTDRKTQF